MKTAGSFTKKDAKSMAEEELWSFLGKVPLFQGIVPEEIKMMLACLGAEQKKYGKQEWLFEQGDSIENVGVVLEGKVQLVQEDYDGNRHIMTEVNKGELFAEAFSCVEETIPFSVVAVEESDILYLNYKRVVTSCSSACLFHTRLIENMLSVLARKNIMLTKKMEHVTKRSTREKLLSYLWEQAGLQQNIEFQIPFDRQQLADYLCVERSAMSHELGKLKEEGYLDYRKNEFSFHTRY